MGPVEGIIWGRLVIHQRPTDASSLHCSTRLIYFERLASCERQNIQLILFIVFPYLVRRMEVSGVEIGPSCLPN